MDPKSFSVVQEMEFTEIGISGEKRPAALCLSGGGIRSATFCLGVLQALARLKLLDEFDYLSTVSGGGYIGGWYSAWRKHPDKGPALSGLQDPRAEPIRWLRRYSNYLSPRLGLFSADAWTLAAIYLRNLFLNWLMLAPILILAVGIPWLVRALFLERFPGGVYWAFLSFGFLAGAYAVAGMSRWLPGVGKSVESERRFVFHHILPMVLSAVLLILAWKGLSSTLGGASLQNLGWFALSGTVLMAIGWFFGLQDKSLKKVLSVFLLGLFGAVEGCVLWLLAWSGLAPGWQDESGLDVVFGTPLVFALLMLGAFISVGVGSYRQMFKDADLEWWARACAWLLIVQVGWLTLSATALWGPSLLMNLAAWLSKEWGAQWVAAGGTLPGLLAAWAGWSSKTLFQEKEDSAQDWKRKVWSWVLKHGPEKVLAPVFLFALFAGVSLGVRHAWDLGQKSWGAATTALVFLGILCFLYVFSWMLSVNRFSMNAMYRNRLIRAYLGASRDRHADGLTGFDPKDNLAMPDLRRRPFHILNLTLNITGGGTKAENLAWQQRRARSFTVSPLHSGWGDSYQESKAYMSQDDDPNAAGISLGTAISLSGAAVSPNCGYHSSRLLTFVMALFNARLGAWAPNPNQGNEKNIKKVGPDSPLVLLREILGMTDDSAPWIYLSDGGHFENLGLYEMVRRRARRLIVCDCGADPKYRFEDLSNAIQKVRADFGYQIGFRKPPELHNEPGKAGKHSAMLEIDYKLPGKPGGEPGRILLIKPALSGEEPRLSRDVARYREDHPEFPQQPTVDQFFDESQFESYRRLGEQSVEEMASGFPGGTLEQFFNHVQEEYLKIAPTPIQADSPC